MELFITLKTDSIANPGTVKNHRGREKGSLIYPVYSRRSQGLSIGVNLFPQGKLCNFDCPYCEVFPFSSEAQFSVEQMEQELNAALAFFLEQKNPIKDICFSGNGEPTLSPHFPAALDKVLQIRDNNIPGSAVVLITNGTGLLDNKIYKLLENKSRAGLDIWLKIDAGTEEWFNKINHSSGMGQRTKDNSFDVLMEFIKGFAKTSPCIIQTMICKVENSLPCPCEEQAWINMVTEIAKQGKLKAVQIYGKARQSPNDPLAQAVDPSILENRAQALTGALGEAACMVPVQVFP